MKKLYGVNNIVGSPKYGIDPIIPVSKATFWAWWGAGRIPRGRKYGNRRFWTEAEVEQMKEVILGQQEAV